ncbi:MAG: murein biosynthesis integral membrane protein MurJ [bacterium]
MSSASFQISQKCAADQRQKGLLKSAGVIGAATMASRILGYIRDMILAHLFGAEMATDAFFVAFKIPNLLRRLLGEGSISASFIPVFTEYLETKDSEEVWDLAGNVLTLAVIAAILLTCAAILFAPGIVLILAPGFVADRATFNLTVLLTRVLFPYVILISVVATAMGILNSLQHFAIPALVPAALNIGIIYGALWISPHFQQPIIGVAVGVLIGGLLQVLMEAPVLKKKGARLMFNPGIGNPGTRRIGVLMLPAALGLGVTQINIMVDTLLASFLPEGSISYLYYSNRLLQLPLALFGISLGTALLPTLSSLASQEKADEMMATFSFGIRTVLFITLPASIGLIVFRIPIISLLFQRGEFSHTATIATARALYAFAIGLCAFSGLKVAIPVFYAHQDTATPVRIGIITILLNIGLSIILMLPFKHAGLALATSLSAIVNLALLMRIMKRRWGMAAEGDMVAGGLKILGNSLAMGFISYIAMHRTFDLYAEAGNLFAKVMYLFSGIGIGIAAYFALSYFTGSKELDFLVRHIVTMNREDTPSP